VPDVCQGRYGNGAVIMYKIRWALLGLKLQKWERLRKTKNDK
jgi:hypothetical protein